MTTRNNGNPSVFPTHQRVLELLHYDSETGVFTWNLRPSKRVHVGDVAGSSTSKGYRCISVDKLLVQAHVLAWFYMTGEWPPMDVDHKNRIRNDNRWKNLRLLTRSDNICNSDAVRGSAPARGVRSTPSGRFQAEITRNYKRHFLGTFDTLEEAVARYAEARLSLHPTYY